MTMPTETLIIVEGAQDAAVVAALLRPHQFEWLESRSAVPDHWKRFIPTQLPHTDKLPIRIDHPRFLRADDGRSVFLRVAGSLEKIPKKLKADLRELAGTMPNAIGILLDADTKSAAARVEVINRELNITELAIRFTGAPGQIAESGGIRCGVFVAPNNAEPGTIERILLEAGESFAPQLLLKARAFVTGISVEDIPSEALREFEKGDRSKSIVHAMGSVLRPGKPTQATLESDDWFKLPLSPMVTSLRDFLVALTQA